MASLESNKPAYSQNRKTELEGKHTKNLNTSSTQREKLDQNVADTEERLKWNASLEIAKPKKEKEISDLLIKEGDVDVEKLLSLHLLALTLPPAICERPHSDAMITEFTRYSNFLPNYFLNSTEDQELYCKCWQDFNTGKIGRGRPCKIHLAINTHIEKIIYTALKVMTELNKVKLQKIVVSAHNVDYLKSILTKDTNLSFITSIYDSGVLKCQNYLRTEACNIIEARMDFVNEIGKFKKNMVFNLKAPSDFPANLKVEFIPENRSNIENNTSLVKIPEAEATFVDELKRSNEISILRNSTSSSGVAFISEDASDITLLSGSKFANKTSLESFLTSLTLVLKSNSQTRQDVNTSYKIPKQTFNMNFTNPNNWRSHRSPKNLSTEINFLKNIATYNLQKHKEIKNKKIQSWLEGTSQDQIRSNILRRLSHDQRVLIGNEIAKVKNKNINMKGQAKMGRTSSMSSAMSKVMSVRSLLDLTKRSSKEERDYLLRPRERGGLGLSEIIIGKHNISTKKVYEKPIVSIKIKNPTSNDENNNVKKNWQKTVPESEANITKIQFPKYKLNMGTRDPLTYAKIVQRFSQVELNRKLKNFIENIDK